MRYVSLNGMPKYKRAVYSVNMKARLSPCELQSTVRQNAAINPTWNRSLALFVFLECLVLGNEKFRPYFS